MFVAQAREETAHALSKQPRNNPPPTCVVQSFVFKTSWAAPASHTLLENWDNPLLWESAVDVWPTHSSGLAQRLAALRDPGLKAVASRADTFLTLSTRAPAYKHPYKWPQAAALPGSTKHMPFQEDGACSAGCFRIIPHITREEVQPETVKIHISCQVTCELTH